MKKPHVAAFENVIEGIAALSSLALVAERVIERVVSARPAKEAREAQTPIAGSEPEPETPSAPAPKRRGRPRAKPRAALAGAEGGLVCRGRAGGEEFRLAWTWAEVAAALGPEGRLALAEEIARVSDATAP